MPPDSSPFPIDATSRSYGRGSIVHPLSTSWSVKFADNRVTGSIFSLASLTALPLIDRSGRFRSFIIKINNTVEARFAARELNVANKHMLYFGFPASSNMRFSKRLDHSRGLEQHLKIRWKPVFWNNSCILIPKTNSPLKIVLRNACLDLLRWRCLLKLSFLGSFLILFLALSAARGAQRIFPLLGEPLLPGKTCCTNYFCSSSYGTENMQRPKKWLVSRVNYVTKS